MRESASGPSRVMGDNSICGGSVIWTARKERARLVPAAAVKPALRVVSMIIELKAFVACLVGPCLNPVAQRSSGRDTALLGDGRRQRYSIGKGEI